MKKIEMIKEDLEAIQLDYEIKGYISTNQADDLIKHSKQLVEMLNAPENNYSDTTKYFMNENAKFTEMKLERIRVFHSSYHIDTSVSTRQSTLNLVVEDYYSKYFREIEKANQRTNE